MSEAKSSLAKTLGKGLAGCLAILAALAAAGTLAFLVLVVGQNWFMGSAPNDMTADFKADIGGTALDVSYDDKLSGEGVLILQDMVANRSRPSMNPLAIMSFNFDYHVTGSMDHQVTVWASPASGYSPSYNVKHAGHSFLWRENGAAFAQVRTADYSGKELATALRPHIIYGQD